MADEVDLWARHTSPSDQEARLQSGEPEDKVVIPPEQQDVSDPVLADDAQDVLAFHPDYASLQGHPHSMTDTELAEVHHHHQQLLLQAQAQAQAQQHAQYEADARRKGGTLQHMDPTQMGASLQQHGVTPAELHLPSLHDADFDKDRKEKRKVANREAARRMRQRRAEQLNTLDHSNGELKTEITTLQQQLSHLANHNRELMAENAALKHDLMVVKAAFEQRSGQASMVAPIEQAS